MTPRIPFAIGADRCREHYTLAVGTSADPHSDRTPDPIRHAIRIGGWIRIVLTGRVCTRARLAHILQSGTYGCAGDVPRCLDCRSGPGLLHIECEQDQDGCGDENYDDQGDWERVLLPVGVHRGVPLEHRIPIDLVPSSRNHPLYPSVFSGSFGFSVGQLCECNRDPRLHVIRLCKNRTILNNALLATLAEPSSEGTVVRPIASDSLASISSHTIRYRKQDDDQTDCFYPQPNRLH